MNFEEFSSNSLANAKHNFLQPELDGTVFIHAECKNPLNNTTWLIRSNTTEEKRRQLMALALAFRHKEVQQYCVASLAWKAIYTGKVEDLPEDFKPSTAPNKEEILIVSSVSIDKQQATTIVEFTRTGDKIEYTSESAMPGKDASGRLLELLDCLHDDVPEEILIAGNKFAEKFEVNTAQNLQ